MNRINGNLPSSTYTIESLLRDPDIWARIVAGEVVSEEHGRWIDKQKELRENEEKNRRLMEWRMNEARKMKDTEDGPTRSEEIQKQEVEENNRQQEYNRGVTILEYASEELKNDRDVVMTAVLQGFPELSKTCKRASLASGSFKERDNYNVVMNAVEKDGHELRFASKEMRHNISIVHAAVKNKEDSIKYASPEIQEKVMRRIYYQGGKIEDIVAVLHREYVDLLERILSKST